MPQAIQRLSHARHRGAFDGVQQQEVAGVAVAHREFPVGLQQQGVAGAQFDVTDLAFDAPAVAGHGDDHRLIYGAELALADGLAHDRAAWRHHRFDEDARGARASPA